MKQTSFMDEDDPQVIGNPALCQFFTPVWVAQALVEKHFPQLGSGDVVLEPSCGTGSFLQAIPQEARAIGVEIDPAIAQRARENTGREVIVGDFRTVEIPVDPTIIIGNPPFRAALFDQFLDRAYGMLPEGAKAGFILPCYIMQTASRVSRYGDRWSIAIDLMPRDAFSSRMRTPLLWAVFSKNSARTLVGFVLYRECDDLHQMEKPYRELFSACEGPVWMAGVQLAMRRLGGRAHLKELYRELERNRPTRTDWWREKIRQTVRVYDRVFAPMGDGVYELRRAA